MQQETLRKHIAAAQGGDEQALAALIASQMPAIRCIASRLICPGLDFEDAVQEGLIGLFRAIESYQPDKTAAFATYTSVCVQNAISSAAKAAQRKKHGPLNLSVPLDDAQCSPGPEEVLLESERYQSAVHSINTRLSTLEKKVLALFLDGKPYSAIARQLSITEKAVGNALQRVRSKLK